MKLISLGCATLLTLFVLGGCQKVIHLDLDSATPRYVVEGTITDQKGTCKVLISRTKAFDDDNSFQGVSGAEVKLATGGDTTLLKETVPGVYMDSLMTGSPGHSYFLSVTVDGNVFTATSTMPRRVNIDSAYVAEESPYGEPVKQMNVVYKDPSGEANYYKFVEFVNRVQVPQLFVSDDQLQDGKKVTATLRYYDDQGDDNDMPEIKTGDTVMVQMQCIDKAVYKYWSSMESSATGTNQSASPANPVSNITGGALGYFSAYTLQEREVIAR